MVTRLALVIVLALVASSCGDGSPIEAAPPSSTIAPTTTTTMALTTTSTIAPATTSTSAAPAQPERTVAPEDPAPAGLPVESQFVVFGLSGIRAVTPEATLVEVSTQPTAAAYAVGDSLVVSQGIGLRDVAPLVGDGPIMFHTPDGITEFTGGDGQRIRLHDVAVVEGRGVAVATIESGSGTEDTEVNLVLIDAITLSVSDLGVVGWWEAGINQAALVGDVIVTIQRASVDQHMAGRSLTGELLWEVKNITDPDSWATLGGGGNSLLVLSPGFDEDFNALLTIDRYNSATGDLMSSEELVVNAEFGGGFCQRADWDGEALICSESYGAPFVVDLTSGAVEPIATLDKDLATHTLPAPSAP